MRKIVIRSLCIIVFFLSIIILYLFNLEWVDKEMGPFDRCFYVIGHKVAINRRCDLNEIKESDVIVLQSEGVGITPWKRFSIREKIIDECQGRCFESNTCKMYTFNLDLISQETSMYTGNCKLYSGVSDGG